MTLLNNKNALIGRDIEALFKNSIGDNPLVVQKIKAYFNLKGDFEHSILSGIHGEKADVKMGFSCGHLIDVNIKGYKPLSGFNQLTRASVKRFCEIFSIAETDREKLEALVVNKSKNTSEALFPITFTKGGFNIGNCISFQRKGGNGSLSKTIPKTNISHPGNNVQMKIKIAKFIDEMKNIILAEYSI